MIISTAKLKSKIKGMEKSKAWKEVENQIDLRQSVINKLGKQVTDLIKENTLLKYKLKETQK